jgi:hypothetical protein
MKIGDLVRHPQGMVNVSVYTYSCGLIIETEMVSAERDQPACLVMWRGNLSPLAYNATSLEVISEGR